MKVTQEKKFTPITIVLETEQEAEYLMSLVGKISGVSKAREFTSELFNRLDSLGICNDTDGKYFKGFLKATESKEG